MSNNDYCSQCRVRCCNKYGECPDKYIDMNNYSQVYYDSTYTTCRDNLSTGAIAAIVIVSVIFVGIVIACIIIYIKRKRQPL
jgi:hypothetical protein